MTYCLSNKYTKNYCHRTILVQIIAEDVVAYFFLKHGVVPQTVSTVGDLAPQVHHMFRTLRLKYTTRLESSVTNITCVASSTMNVSQV